MKCLGGGGVRDDRSGYLLNHKGNKLEFMAPVWGAALGWFLLLLTAEGYPWWTHLLNHG